MGERALDLMVMAGIIAFVLVSVFMLVYYRLPGFVAVISLVGQVAGSIAAVSGYFGFIPSFTLTLPGIAGIILSIGMGVDANIITAERIKEQIRLGKLKLVPKEKNEGPYEITEMTSKDDGSFTIRLNATKMLHFASISSTTTENVLDVLELIINDKPVEEWKGLLVPQGEIVIQGSFKDKTVDPLQSMRLSPTMVLEDEKGNPFDLQFSTQRKRQEGFNVFNLLSTTRKGGSE